jgi:hypothetical protein
VARQAGIGSGSRSYAAARDANDSAWRSSMAARTGNWIAAAALVVAVIALVISIFK